ncbi:MAG: anaerobic ribonucleoside-triphosphate reductase activating protein [Ndongobacter sp.]|nr:anaerobic ribonucleoside-triphosphate reductase activating protein [Ndongobacter sp.]
MNIGGLQKVTLLDYPGLVACTVFLGGCNFRCPYCHNASLLDGRSQSVMSEEELLRFLAKRRGLLDGVCITGGEPLLQSDLGPLLRQIRDQGYRIKLDTNGTNPARLKEFVRLRLLDFVAMDIKNAPRRYAETIGGVPFRMKDIEESVSFLLSGAIAYEFRTTVVSELHGETEFVEMAQWLKGASHYYLQPFENRGDVLCGTLHAPTDEELAAYLEIVRSYIPTAAIRGRMIR